MVRADLENVVVIDKIKNKVGVRGSASFKIDDNSKLCKKIETRDKIVDGLEIKKVRKEKRCVGMNKKKVRSKIIAYSQLQASKKFLAFYSISFPDGMSDKDIKKIHNTVLTRIRKLRSNFTYIWIAEKQKNGTLHFHMITNSYFNIRIINRYYSRAIDNQINKSYRGLKFDIDRYNGVDVVRVRNHNTIAAYVTKYVTKNDTEIVGLNWNCSKDVSALFTSLLLSHSDFLKIAKSLVYIDTYKIKTSDGMPDLDMDMYSYDGRKPKLIFGTIEYLNNLMMKEHFNGLNLVK